MSPGFNFAEQHVNQEFRRRRPPSGQYGTTLRALGAWGCASEKRQPCSILASSMSSRISGAVRNVSAKSDLEIGIAEHLDLPRDDSIPHSAESGDSRMLRIRRTKRMFNEHPFLRIGKDFQLRKHP